MKDFNFHLPTQIIYGCGKVMELKQIIGKDVRNILIVTDKNVFERSGVQDSVLKQLKDYKVEIFDEVEQNPAFNTVNKGAQIAREKDIQLIIGIGGGSPIDTAKGIAAFKTNRDSIKHYMEGRALQNNPIPVVSIPTTSGTGTEVTPYAIFTDVDNAKKMCLSSPKIFPQFSIIDPELTYTMPEHIIVNTGVDALTHAIEAYLSTVTFPLNDMFAVNAIKIVLKNLNSASKKDKEAMNKMAYASMLAGISISHSSTILLHIMGYPLTVFHGIPHGKANGILLPAFFDFMKRQSYSYEKVNRLEKMFEVFGGVHSYINDLNIDTKLSSYGIKKEEFEKFAQDTIVKDDIKITPADITTEDIIEIYNNTY